MKTNSGMDVAAILDRMEQLETKVQQLTAELASLRPRPPWDKSLSNIIDDEEFHKACQEVQEIIRKNREADRKRVEAEFDRLERRAKNKRAVKKAARKPAPKARRAG